MHALYTDFGRHRSSGQSLEDFLQENIFVPLNMTTSSFDCSGSDIALGHIDYAETTPDVVQADLDVDAVGDLYSPQVVSQGLRR